MSHDRIPAKYIRLRFGKMCRTQLNIRVTKCNQSHVLTSTLPKGLQNVDCAPWSALSSFDEHGAMPITLFRFGNVQRG